MYGTNVRVFADGREKSMGEVNKGLNVISRQFNLDHKAFCQAFVHVSQRIIRPSATPWKLHAVPKLKLAPSSRDVIERKRGACGEVTQQDRRGEKKSHHVQKIQENIPEKPGEVRRFKS